MATAAIPAEKITLQRSINVPVSQVYNAFTQRDWLRDWFCDDAHLRSSVGGHLLLTWYTGYYAVGTYKVLEPDQQIVFSWRGTGETSDSEITVDLSEQAGQTDLTLHITGYHPDAEAVVRREWDTRLDNLVHVLETGGDLRLENRIILGITPGAVSSQVAEQLGLNEGEGLAVNGTIEGMGAADAGLAAGDVIVTAEGQRINTDNPLNMILASKKPGDQTTITYYRDGEQQQVTITLSGYPVPELPADFAALADRTEQQYNDLMQEIEALFVDVSEAEAAHRPAEGEWNANEVLAHLVLTERWLQNWIGGLMQGPEIAGYTCNAPARIAGVTATYPTNAAMLAEMRRAFAETVAILRHIPAAFAERKTNLWWTSFEVSSISAHTQSHLPQIQSALASARA